VILAVLAIVSATLQPAQPKVGDLITVQFQAPVTLDPAQDYEVVSRGGNKVVLRTFLPKPFVLSGVTGNVRFTNLIVPVGTVLAKNDQLTPAPLVPPREVPYPRAPFIAIALAALAAIAAWAAVWWRSKRRVRTVQPELVLAPEERFRRAVLALREDPSQQKRWARLADETRAYLAATRPDLRTDLTTTELVPRLGEAERVVVDILRMGDFEKFAPSVIVKGFQNADALPSVSLSREDDEGSQNATAGASWLRSSPPRSFGVSAPQDDALSSKAPARTDGEAARDATTSYPGLLGDEQFETVATRALELAS
jgi:hypothetical protein